MSADTYPNKHSQGPTGEFDWLGRVDSVRFSEGQVCLGVKGGRFGLEYRPDFELTLGTGSLCQDQRFPVEPGQHVFREEKSMPAGPARGVVCNNRLFLLAP